MAWPLSGRKRSKPSDADVDDDLSLQRLEAMTNVGYEEVPLPDEGELSSEEAWTISPAAAAIRIGSQLTSTDTGASSSASASGGGPVQTVSPTVDTKSLERLISSRLDMVEDTMRSMAYQVQQSIVSVTDSSQEEEGAEDTSEQGDGDQDELTSSLGDRIVPASGEMLSVAAGSQRLAAEDEGQLMELYEAQALALNPFLATPEGLEEISRGLEVGAHTIAALLLDNMSGMAATSFLQKAVQSGMLDEEEFNSVIAIVHMAVPGEPESALEDRLPNMELLTLSSLITAWRGVARDSSSMEG